MKTQMIAVPRLSKLSIALEQHRLGGVQEVLNIGLRTNVHAIVAQRSGGPALRSHHATQEEARRVLTQTIDLVPIQVIPATVVLATNGNVRFWQPTQ